MGCESSKVQATESATVQISRYQEFLQRCAPSISLISDKEAAACLDMWVDSFQADPPNPMFLWIVKDERLSKEEQRRRLMLQLRYMLDYVARPLKQYGATLVIRDDSGAIQAAAGLYMPGTCKAPGAMSNLMVVGLPPVVKYAPRWGTLGWKKLDSLKAVDRAKADLLKEVGPSWYLQLLGVKPGLQKAGYGRRLLEAICAFSDEQQMPTLLDCETEWHENYYGRFGFRTWRRVDLEVKGCEEKMPQFIMLRPQGKAKAV
ncbi:unnamed protein product [Effrenium voratum]|uniref:N-acetyltransferase domain-containing protein n=1 Tax=Effrenium voratum TaxID=2562239 RepID=A0AA36I7Z8_9DINO|nr:unnamed protein product [Effrenium voratum]CAJ1431419.1 unnamed protein product [Effrenium voratum]